MAQDTLLGFPAHILPYRFLDSLRQGKHLPFWPVLTSFWKGALLVEKRIDRVIFTCGGTAGHVNPAIAVAQLMAEKNPQIKILFVGAERGLEKDLIQGGERIPYRSHLQLSPLPQAGGDQAQSGVPLQYGPLPGRGPGYFEGVPA